MGKAPGRKFTLGDLRRARSSGEKVPVLTCYDFTTAQLMHEVGVPVLLVGDSAANVILGHPTTLPVSLDFMIELTAGVRRGAPDALLMADMPFGSYQGGCARAVRNVCRMVQLSNCDCVKLEAAGSTLGTVRRLSDSGVAIVAHLGLRPQAVGVMGGYRYQGRTAEEADAIVSLASKMHEAGAVALLLEAVPNEVSEAVIASVPIPVIGCGAGPSCHGHVVVTHDILGLTARPPKFAPALADIANPTRAALSEYIRQVEQGVYPSSDHEYVMAAGQRDRFLSGRAWSGSSSNTGFSRSHQ